MASNIIDDRDESFISKFRDSFIEENDADSAGISPYASVPEADLCTYYTVEDYLSHFGRRNKNSFAIASLNIRSLPGQWDALRLASAGTKLWHRQTLCFVSTGDMVYSPL